MDERVLVPPHLITHVPVYQAHWTPPSVMYPQGPFNPDILRPTPPVPAPAEEMDRGETAQNDMQPVQWFRCTVCEDIVREEDLDTHRCSDGA